MAFLLAVDEVGFGKNSAPGGNRRRISAETAGQIAQFFNGQAQAAGLLVEKDTGSRGAVGVDFVAFVGAVLVEPNQENILAADEQNRPGIPWADPSDSLDRRHNIVDTAAAGKGLCSPAMKDWKGSFLSFT